MDSGFLRKKGITILEVTVVLFIVGVFLSMVIPSYISRINQAKYEKTINELTSIAQATVDYFNLTGSWPDPTQWASQLTPQFMAYAVTSSPFGTTYNINCVNDRVTAYVLIPGGIAQRNSQQGQLWIKSAQGSQDKIEISQIAQNEFTSRLNYCLNNQC